MSTKPKKPQKVKVTLRITKEAQDIMLDNGYASVRGMGAFISALIMDYHARQPRKPAPARMGLPLFVHSLSRICHAFVRVQVAIYQNRHKSTCGPSGAFWGHPG